MCSLNYTGRNSGKSSLKIGSASIFGIPSPKMKQNRNVFFVIILFLCCTLILSFIVAAL